MVARTHECGCRDGDRPRDQLALNLIFLPVEPVKIGPHEFQLFYFSPTSAGPD